MLLLPIVLILIQAVASEIWKPATTRVVVSSSAVEIPIDSEDQPRMTIAESGNGYEIDFIDHAGTRSTLLTSDLSADKAAALPAFGTLVSSVNSGEQLSPKQREEILEAGLDLTGFSENRPEQSMVLKLIAFFGHPFTALIIAIFAAAIFLAKKQGFSRDQIMDLSNSALAPAGIIILVTGAGGVFKQILIDSNVATVMAEAIVQSNINIVVLSFLISALVRIAQGSATVAMVTTAAIIAPLLPGMSGLSSSDYALLTIAIASGATVLSHVNDSGFWLVSKFFGLTEKETLMSWTVVETIIGISGFIGALTLSYFL
ncbi:GntT/GntP/DsdX family permease [Rubripirellula reticaptiva]|uniref:GntT/GntP/DsdX family permease n=1 Tax=Rubripirellula reticaptiva TaxID=2528013 RepID=UPI001C959A19|nr:hypothetical protein [Rubripirellula reticaptiva]